MSPLQVLPRTTFVVLIACLSGFSVIYCLTVAVPSALSVVRALNGTATDALVQSGELVASTSVGLMVGAATIVALPDSFTNSRWPYLVMCGWMVAGGVLYFLAVELAWPLLALLLARSVMTMGGGALYACKRQCGAELDTRRRKFLFMLLELGSTLGMAGGPLLAGLVGVGMGREEAPRWWAPSTIIGLGVLLLPIFAFWPLQQPFSFPCLRLEHGEHGAAAQGEQEPTGGGEGGAGEQTDARVPAGAVVGAVSCKVAPVASEAMGDLLSRGNRPPPVWVSAIVQPTCICYGISRLFLKFGFESAMVVVYDEQYRWSNAHAAVVAGGLALCSVATIFGYTLLCANRMSERRLLLLSDSLGYTSVLLMILVRRS